MHELELWWNDSESAKREVLEKKKHVSMPLFAPQTPQNLGSRGDISTTKLPSYCKKEILNCGL